MGAAVEKAVGKRVARLRETAGLTQQQLADRVRVAVETISRLERGASIPSVSRLDDIARALGVGMHDLFEPSPASSARKPAVENLVELVRSRSPAEIELVADMAQRVFDHLDGASSLRGRTARARK